MLYPLACILLLSSIINHRGMAESHKAWALQQQEKSQAMIKYYEQEALALKRQTGSTSRSILSPPISKTMKACRADQEQPCDKKPIIEPIHETILYIFVSFSLPKETLKALALEAEKQKGVLVIRGLVKNSFVKTAKAIQEIGAGVVLDPALFKEYNVQVVPTFVQKHKNTYQKIAGNISLSYALEKFKSEEGREEMIKADCIKEQKTAGEPE